jgi:hypothetical protein
MLNPAYSITKSDRMAMIAVMRRLGFVDEAAALVGLPPERFRLVITNAPRAPRFQWRALVRLRARLAELGAYAAAGVIEPLATPAAAG